MSETRLYTFPSCPSTGPNVFDGPAQMAPLVAALVSAVVSPLVDAVVDKGVNALTEAAKDKDFQVPSPEPVMKEFYEVGISGETTFNSQVGCVVLVRGEFETGDYQPEPVEPGESLPDIIAAKFRVWAGSGAHQKRGDPYVRVKSGTLELYFEVAPVLSDDGKMLGLRPQALYLGRFASKDGLFGSSRRNYQFTITFADPFGSQAFASADFKYEGLEKPFSKVACPQVPQTTYCAATELGGIRGWYVTKPISEDFAPVIKKRQANAVTLKTAITDWTAPPPRPTVPDDVPGVAGLLKTYCAALESANRPRLAGQQQWDERCPPDLALAKREYLYGESIASARLEKQRADDFWAKMCVDSTGQSLRKDDDGLVKCLKVLAGGKEPVLAGRFLLTSTIVETRPGNNVAAFFAPAAEKVAPSLKTAVKEKLDPVEREKVAAAAATKASADAKTKRDALNAVTLADDGVKAAQVSYDAALAKQAATPGDAAAEVAAITAHIALLKAQIAANDSYRAADLPIPFPVIG
ncbi:hypothetical protein SAMN06295970_14213 [Noviherbaspirillum suwonense]|uniref:Uncharacterized protein n=2 Tax=Noviherbaspirillum suwonense TaxID=1224511 RepID=A0ABY1QUI4_9BURK|nr:hypothetical protein SAMN06295970_14213 [Noviherbaspirillum suwonense]